MNRLKIEFAWIKLSLAVGIAFLAPLNASAEVFAIAIGDTISDGVPGVGAGRLLAAKDDDVYTFAATAGQLVFIEGLSQDAAFKRNLRWSLIKPSGLAIFSGYFSGPQGRKLLTESGTYKVRVFSDGTDPTWIGSYSFRVTPIPPDQTFPYAIGNLVSNNVPAAGAGRLEMGGSEDNFTFTAIAGHLVFFESLTQDAAFKNSLRWQLIKPSGPAVFSSFFSFSQGRIELSEAGQYRIRIFTDGNDSALFGAYTFRTSPIPPDQSFPYAIGTEVSDGVPAAGAGRLEVGGSRDSYLFSATAGQVVFFESLSQDPKFKNNLRWRVLRPSGGSVFSAYFIGVQGRTVLPESGQYRIEIFTDSLDPQFFGPYSFRTRADISDQQFTMNVGDIVSDGKPVVGAGNLETAGSTDTYTFTARSGQFVVFDSLSQAASLKNALRWQLLKPSGGAVFSSFFANKQGRIQLPEVGAYKLRIFMDNGSTLSGTYSFRTFSPVTPYPDFIATRPNQPVTMPVAKLLFNDEAEDSLDVLDIDLPAASTFQGGTVTLGANGVLYTPKNGFTGTDRFDYRLVGSFGGTNQTTVTVGVGANARAFAGVVNWVRRSTDSMDVCFLGDPGKEYAMETSPDLAAGIATTSVTPPASGFFTFPFNLTPGANPLYLRARRK